MPTIKNAPLRKLDGSEIQNSSNPPGYEPKTDDPILYVADVISNVCMAPVAQGQAPYRPDRAAKRYQLAIATFELTADEEFDVPADLVVELDNDIARCYPVIVSGQMHLLLK